MHVGSNYKGPYTTSVPAHAVTKGQQIIVDHQLIFVRQHPRWISKGNRYTGCVINSAWYDFNKPIEVVVGSCTTGGGSR